MIFYKMKYFKQKLNKVLDKKDVKIPEKEFVKEHKRLIDVLESPSHKDDLKEAKEQSKELQSHLNKSEIAFYAFNDGTIDLEAGSAVPEEIFNQVCFELSKNFDLIDIEILEKKKKAFQFKSKHKSKRGGLTEAGRKAYNKATGSKLKRPQPGGGKRKKSFCARSKGQMKMHGISCKKDPKKRVCLARKRWACKSESSTYFESLKKAKIYDFQSKKLLADFPVEQSKELQQPSTKMREANHLDSLRTSLPSQTMTAPEHFDSVLPHKDEKSQLDFLNTVHGDFVDYGSGDIGSRVRSGYLHVKAQDHLKLADHYLRNAAKRPDHQQETADRDLADAYEHLFLAKEKLKTKKPKKIKKSETDYFEILLKCKKKIQKLNKNLKPLKKVARTVAVKLDPEKMKMESEQAEKRFQHIQGLKQQNINDKINLINSTEPQKKLVEGISWNRFVPYIGDSEAAKQKLRIGSTVNKQGQKVFIKENHPHPFLEDANLPSAQREVLFHDLSHFFGTQNYVPTTSLMHDGKKLYSVQQFLDNYEHSKHSKQKISDFVPEKDLQKLAITDAILANGDRHRNNFLIETEKPGKVLGEFKPKTIKLIDNGFAFDYPKKRKIQSEKADYKKYFSTLVPTSFTPGEQGRKMPKYLNRENLSKPLPEDLKKWILDLYSNKESALKLFKKHGASNETINHFQNRLKHAVKLSQRNLPLGNILFSIDKMGV